MSIDFSALLFRRLHFLARRAQLRQLLIQLRQFGFRLVDLEQQRRFSIGRLHIPLDDLFARPRPEIVDADKASDEHDDVKRAFLLQISSHETIL